MTDENVGLQLMPQGRGRVRNWYHCPRCRVHVKAGFPLSPRLERVRFWSWRQAHKLNCQL